MPNADLRAVAVQPTPTFSAEAPAASMIVVQNWFEELKAKLAAGK